jgi:cytosine/adenosine deaminase-related metal-dependent hydrolase
MPGNGTHGVVVVLRNVSVACPADGSVVVRDLYLASPARPTQAFEIELRDHVVLPALVNAHDHLHQNGVPPLPLTTPFRNSYEWAAAFRDHFGDAAVKAELSKPLRARLWHGGLKNALCGATTVMHHDPAHDTFDVTSFPVRVSQPYTWAHSLHLAYGPNVVESYCAAPPEVPWFIHLGEGTDPLAAGELQELRQLGCLSGNTVLIHAVGLGDADVVDILRAGAGVVWCPSSNLSLLGQTITPHRLRALFDAGCLALGTDSRLTGARDLLAELEVAAGHSDFSPRELLQLVTERAVQLLRTTESADCIVIRDRATDPFSAFIGLQRAQLRAVVRGGEPFITDPDFAEWFNRLGIPCTAVLLDGQPKLCRSDALSYRGVPTGLVEPGFTVQ